MSRKNAITRKRFLSDSSISQLIMRRPSSSWPEKELAVAWSAHAVFGRPLEPALDMLDDQLDPASLDPVGLQREHEFGTAIHGLAGTGDPEGIGTVGDVRVGFRGHDVCVHPDAADELRGDLGGGFPVWGDENA